MPCAFDLERPPPFHDLDPGCQFDVPGAEIIDFGGKTWCRFHLPLEAKDAQGKPKADWGEQAIKAFNEAIFAFIDRARSQDRTADLTGVVFPGDITFDRYRAGTSALLSVIFFRAHFSGNAGFHEVQFSGDAWFREARFSGDAGFDQAQFSGEASFDKAQFSGPVRFEKAQFSGTALFHKAQFSGHAWFDEAQFSDDAWFEKAHFGRDAFFSKAQFSGIAGFGGAQFSARAWFDEPQFSGDASFGQAQFSGGAWFIEARFSSAALFSGARFDGHADFREVRFDGNAEFSNTTFSRDANFEAAIFSNRALFNPAIFEKNANFAGAAEGIGKPKTIQKVKLTTQPAKTVPAGDGSFKTEGTVWEPPRPPGNLFGRADFSRAEFHAGADFNNRRFADETLFRGTQFAKAPKFHNADLHQDTDFMDADFQDKSGEAAPAYCTLKLAMGRARAVDEEAMFYALEMESRRKREDTPPSVKVFSRLYERAADYGRSFTRPLGWLGETTGVFFLVYLICFAALVPGGLGEQDVWDVGRFTMRQIVPPFDAFTLGTTEGLPAGLSRLPLWLGFVAMIQSIVSLGLIGLFILALRRRFRMG